MSDSSSTSNTLAADAVDLEKENLRLKAYSKFSPEYYFDSIHIVPSNFSPKSEIKENWRLVAKAEASVFSLSNFENKLWIEQPEKIFKPIKSSINTYKNTFIERELIPKRIDKDSSIKELVSFLYYNKGLVVEFKPLVNSIEEIQAFRFLYTKGEDFIENEQQPSNHFTDPPPIPEIQIHALEFPGHSNITGFQRIWTSIFVKLFKWSVTQSIGFTKRANHDSLVPRNTYDSTYTRLKNKYADFLFKNWTEKSDPKKFIYEDIAIATWLICLWKSDSFSNKKNTFVDIGCGNGLLVYILSSEGYKGYGIDQSTRKIWNILSSSADLRSTTIIPNDTTIDAEWIIGNHPDELSPWIPVIANKSGFSNFVIIPCCFYDFNGKKMNIYVKKGESKYGGYIRYISSVIQDCGFVAQRDFLRIPSTRNSILLGTSKNFK
ncbi:hypothetical protein BB560_004076, partial [Smittium megazygosporum]